MALPSRRAGLRAVRGVLENAVLRRARTSRATRWKGFARSPCRMGSRSFMTRSCPRAPLVAPRRRALSRAGTRGRAGRARILDGVPYDITPATDERPYFYWVRPSHAGLSASDHGGGSFRSGRCGGCSCWRWCWEGWWQGCQRWQRCDAATAGGPRCACCRCSPPPGSHLCSRRTPCSCSSRCSSADRCIRSPWCSRPF